MLIPLRRYYEQHIKGKNVSINTRLWHGLVWQPITIDEMHRFFGILLRISLHPTDRGGYTSYFSDGEMYVKTHRNRGEGNGGHIRGTAGFVSKIPSKFRMSLNRFKQIRGCFHPENKMKANGLEDKCYHIRATMNELNAAAVANFVPEGNLAFDEGGCGCRSRYCPVRQYNKDKPDKFRVDFFIMAGSTSRVIYDIDVYQGKNPHNVGVPPLLRNLPTTMKAVVNAIEKSQVNLGCNDTNGYRVISLDNRYQCPQLAHLVWARYVRSVKVLVTPTNQSVSSCLRTGTKSCS